VSKASIPQLKDYLNKKKLAKISIKSEIEKHPSISPLFIKKNWYQKVDEQIILWECDSEKSLIERDITIPEYELFRYLEEDSILERFLTAVDAIEGLTVADRSRYRNWKETKCRLFSRQVSQIYSALFEILVIGDLISSETNVEPYHANIDGRFKIDRRYIYFEIKSLQQSHYDLTGIGVGGVQHDEHQILTALKEKAAQLAPFCDEPTLLFLSLYRLADIITGEWFTNDFFNMVEGSIISGVVLFSWFTAGRGKKVLINSRAKNPLSSSEVSFLNA